MGREDHIRSLRIQNFKCFEDFRMENIGQFNLIVGANNAGKTSLLEALLLKEDDSAFFLHEALIRRNASILGSSYSKFDLLHSYRNLKLQHPEISLEVTFEGQFTETYSLETSSVSKIKKDEKLRRLMDELYGASASNIFNSDVNILITRNSKSAFDEQGMTGMIPMDSVVNNADNRNIPFISVFDLNRSDLVEQYSSNVQFDSEIEERFVKYLKIIVPELDSVEIFIDQNTNKPAMGLRVKGSKSIVPLSMFGDGTVRLFLILTKMFSIGAHSLVTKFLMIDEVDFGIHLGLLSKFWESLLELATRLDVQLFMTTHSTECVQSYWKVFESKKLKNKLGVERDEIVRHFILERDKSGNPRSYSLPHSHLGHAIENDNNFMGR